MSKLSFHYNIGDKVHNLTIISYPYMIVRDGKDNLKKIMCRCDCGVEKEIGYGSLRDGSVKSCGCLHKKQSIELCKSRAKYSKNITNHKLHNSWLNMKRKYPNGFIETWRDYNMFYDWAIGLWFEKACLIRIDPDLPYSDSNCVFVHKAEINRQNLNINKTKQTMITKYGAWYTTTDEHKNRVKQTNLKKYGYEYIGQVPEFQEKKAKTNMDRYGFTVSLKNPEVIEKIHKTMIGRYGANHPSKVPEIRAKQMDTCMERYGSPYPNQCNLGQQNQVKDFIESVSGKEFRSDRSILGGKEIDLYNEELKLGFEYCGLYWHSEYNGKDRNYHYNKYKVCADQGIRLVTIFSDEWINRQEQVKGYISSILGSSNKVYARDLTVSHHDCKDFFNQYHIQGMARTLFSISLINEEGVIGAASFGLHHRNNQQLVLNRLAFKGGYQIVGGSKRILTHAINKARELGYGDMVTWSDNRWSNGDVYKHLGFTIDSIVKPDYDYVLMSNPKYRVSKQSCQKSKIGCPKDMTEKEYMYSLGYTRIWDCGKTKWKLSLY